MQAPSSGGPREATSAASTARAGYVPRTPTLRATKVRVLASEVRPYPPLRFPGRKADLVSMGQRP